MYTLSYNCSNGLKCLVNSLKNCSYNSKKLWRYQINLISLQFFSNCSSPFSRFYCFKLIKHIVSLYCMNHDANQWNEIWETTSKCSLKTERFFHSFTHIIRFLRFLNGNWHKITVWQIQTGNSNNRVSSSKFIMDFSCCQRTELLKKKVFSRFISSPLFWGD